MLLDFRFKNFRSFREEACLSLASSNYDKKLQGNLLDVELPGLKKTRFLRGTAIYGANASGKSNVIRALFELQRLVRNSHTFEAGSGIAADPFFFDDESLLLPTIFEVRFVVAGVRYHYAIAYNQERFIEEELSAYPKGTRQLWYLRSWDEKKGVYDHDAGDSFSLRKQDIDSTKENSLLLSTATNLLNHPKLGAVYSWFREKLDVRNLAPNGLGLDGLETLAELRREGQQVVALLKKADLGVTNARLLKGKIDSETLAKLPASTREQLADQEITTVRLAHRGRSQSELEIDFNEESAGTIRFFELAGPWLNMIREGKVLALDEIETSLHPLLVRELVRLVMDPKVNTKGAQLIVATHDPLLLDLTLLRRDQIWLTEKTAEGDSILYALNEYEKPPTNRESLVRGYLSGRYGGIPFIPHGLIETAIEEQSSEGDG